MKKRCVSVASISSFILPPSSLPAMSDEADIPLATPEPFIPYAGYHHSQARANRPGQSTFLSAVFAAFWFICGLVVLGALAGLVWLVTSDLVAGASPLLGVLLLIAVGTMFRGIRRRRAIAALNYVEQAVRLNLPLPAMIGAAEAGETGRLRKKLRDLRERLEDGHPIGEALDVSLPGLPARAVSLIAAAERNGRVAPTLARLVRELRRRPQHDPSRAILLRWYPIVLVMALSSVLGFFAVFVMPKYDSIFRDFDVPLPPLTTVTMRVWQWLGIPVGALMALIALVICGRMVAETVAPLWSRGNLGPVGYFTDALIWWAPVASGVVRNRGLADLCRVVADAAEAGRPMHAGLRDASRLGVNHVLRGKIDQWAEGVEGGTPLGEAARNAGMPRLLSGMLATTSARGSADAAGVFEFLARYYDGRFSRAAALLEGAMVPVMVMVFAFFVGSAALGLYLPMINLIEHMSDLTRLN